jgi:hypothetical protein
LATPSSALAGLRSGRGFVVSRISRGSQLLRSFGTARVGAGSGVMLGRTLFSRMLEPNRLVAGDRSFGPPGQQPAAVRGPQPSSTDSVTMSTWCSSSPPTRVEVLERALAERPGRVDEAVEIGAPDAAGRNRLLRLYGADAGLADLDLTATIEQTQGLTATFLREIVRRAVIAAALARPGETPIRVQQADLEAAVAQLQTSRAQLTRALLGQDRGITEPPGPYIEHGTHSGFVAFGQHHGFASHATVDIDDDAAPAPIPPGWEDED